MSTYEHQNLFHPPAWLYPTYPLSRLIHAAKNSSIKNQKCLEVAPFPIPRRISFPPSHDLMLSRSHALVLLCCRSEEHTSELQSRENLVCRLLLEKKNNH